MMCRSHKSRVLHMTHFPSKLTTIWTEGVPSVHLSPIWGVNRASQKFGGTLKNVSKFRVVKCNFPLKLPLKDKNSLKV